MADVNIWDVTLTGRGTEDLGATDEVNYITCYVTDTGFARNMDLVTPSRLLRAGWIAFGDYGPGAGPDFPTPVFWEPIFIGFERTYLPTGIQFSQGLMYPGVIRYELEQDVEVRLMGWHF
jgi:hypothetical protein